MSQVVKAISAADTGDRRYIKDKISPLFQDVFDVKSQISELRDSSGQVIKVYKIGVTLGNSVAVSELDQLQNPGSLTEAINTTKRAVIEGIFGEFRPYFRRMEMALANYDTEKARLILHELEDLIYEAK